MLNKSNKARLRTAAKEVEKALDRLHFARGQIPRQGFEGVAGDIENAYVVMRKLLSELEYLAKANPPPAKDERQVDVEDFLHAPMASLPASEDAPTKAREPNVGSFVTGSARK